MAVAVCYHARLQEREGFEIFIATEFLPPFSISDRKQFLDEIVKYFLNISMICQLYCYIL